MFHNKQNEKKSVRYKNAKWKNLLQSDYLQANRYCAGKNKVVFSVARPTLSKHSTVNVYSPVFQKHIKFYNSEQKQILTVDTESAKRTMLYK